MRPVISAKTTGPRQSCRNPARTRNHTAHIRSPPIVHIGDLSYDSPARRCPPHGGYHESLHGRQPHHRSKAAQIARLYVVVTAHSPRTTVTPNGGSSCEGLLWGHRAPVPRAGPRPAPRDGCVWADRPRG